MTIDADKAKRLIDILNKASADNNKSGATTTRPPDATSLFLENDDVAAVIQILKDPLNEDMQSPSIDHYDQESEQSRFKQIALAAVRYALVLSSPNPNDSTLLEEANQMAMAKRIMVDCLLPLTSLSTTWIEPFIITAVDILIENVVYAKGSSFGPVSTLGIETLLGPYVSRLDPQQAQELVEKLSCSIMTVETKTSHQEQLFLNPYSAAAVVASLHETHEQLSLLTPQLVRNLVKSVLVSLRTLYALQEYDSIPPLIYQLCALTKLSFGAVSSATATMSVSSTKELELSYEILYGIAQLLSEFDTGKEQIRWTIGTSLSHLARIFRNNSSLPNVLLGIIKGNKAHLMAKSANDNSNNDNTGGDLVELQRFKRLTPMMLAIGLTAASTIPRIKMDLLEAIRDLVVEEELMRWKRCHSRWVNGTMALISSKGNINEMGDCDEDGIYQEEMLKDLKRFQQQSEASIEKSLFDDSHILKCMNSVVELVISSADERISDAEFSALLPTLISIGFILIDSVKKDTLVDETSGMMSGVLLPTAPSCASEVAQNSMQNIMKKANASAAKIGRRLLVNIFIHSAENNDTDGITVIDSGISKSSSTLSPQCRMILQRAREKFCGMAPNALEHSHLLRDLMFYQSQCDADSGDLRCDTTFGKGAHILEECFIPSLNDVLANIPGGGMPPLVATISVIPVLGSLLSLSRQKGKRSRRKRIELNDHVDHCFLLAKKALFCTDADRRKVAVNLLVMLCRFAADGGGNETALLDEVKGYLRRCMTQHQSQVRLEAYRSLVAIVPHTVDEDTVTEKECPEGMSPHNDNIREVVAQILLDQLERYTTLEEDPSVIEARRNRAILHGTHLSQQADVDSFMDDNKDEAPLCLDKCISTVRNVSSQGNVLGIKRKKVKSAKLDLLEQALCSISEPISFLLGACLATIDGHVSGQIPGSAIAKLNSALIRLKTKVSSTDLSNYLKICVRSGNNSSTQEQFVKMLSTCLVVASVAETLMSAPSSNDLDASCLLNLFRLRCEAVSHASAIIVSDKLEQGKNRAKKRKAEKSDDNANKLEKEEKDIDVLIEEAKHESNQKAIMRAEAEIETALSSLSPSLSPFFLNESLRQYGIIGQADSSGDLLYATQSIDDNMSPQIQLMSSQPFRKFLIEQCNHLIAGRKLLLKAGNRFDVDVALQGADSVTKYTPSVFMLAPILFSECLAHIQNKNASSGQSGPALSFLAFEGFKLCLQRLISFNTASTNLSQAIVKFFKTSVSVANIHFPNIQENWKRIEFTGDIVRCIDNDEREILDAILPFVMPIGIINEQNSKPSSGLLVELLCRGLDAEASMCCEVIKLTLPYLSSDLRQILSLFVLESFQTPDSVEVITGFLGIDVENANVDCQSAASTAIDVAIYADGLMDGSTEIPKIYKLNEDHGRRAFDLTFLKSQYLELATGRSFAQSEFHSFDGDQLPGIIQLIASSFQATNKVGSNFEVLVGSATSLFHFVCTDIVAARDASADLVSKYLSTASNSILAAIDNGLSDVEFITIKVVPHVLGNRLVLLQKCLVNLLYSLAKVVCTTCLCSEYFDDSGHFMSTLLKSCTRLYASYTKLLLLGHLSQYPKSLTNAENKKFLLLKKNKLQDRVMALLLTLSEKLKVGNKELADSKISSHGRIAEQVVFEIERCDNAIINLGTKLKASGHDTESKFLLAMVSTGASVRGFRIDSDEIKEARQRVQQAAKPKKEKSKTRDKPKKTIKDKEKTAKSTKKENKRRIIGDDDQDDQSDNDNSLQGSEHCHDDGHNSDDSGNHNARGRSDDDDNDGDDDDANSIIGCFVVNSDSDENSEEEDDDDTKSYGEESDDE